MKPTAPTPSYIERAGALKTAAAPVEFGTMAKVYEQFDTAAKGIESNSISASNLARKLGIHLQALCGHEQIKFSYWQSHCEGKLPFNYESAKLFVAVARKMPRDAQTIAEAVHFVQMVLVADQSLELPQRTERQLASPISPIQRFLAEMTLIRQPFQKSIRALPMEQWEPAALDTFLTETEWLSTEREKAQRLRAK